MAKHMQDLTSALSSIRFAANTATNSINQLHNQFPDLYAFKNLPYSKLTSEKVRSELDRCFYNPDWYEEYMEDSGPYRSIPVGDLHNLRNPGDIKILKLWQPFFKNEAKRVLDYYINGKATWAAKNGHYPDWFVKRLIGAIEIESKANRDDRLRFNLKHSFGWPWLALLGLPFVAFAQNPAVATGVYLAAVMGICLLTAMFCSIAHPIEKDVETKHISLFKDHCNTFLTDQKAKLENAQESVVQAELVC